MENIVCNISGKVRREIMFGREFIVAPLKMIKPQVLNGDKGPIFYQETGIVESEDAWNHMPIVNGHPDPQEHKSARTPDFLKEKYLGTVFNAKYDEEEKVLNADGWFDVERVQSLSADLLKALQLGKPVELSTGIGFRGHALNDEQVFEDQPYKIVAEKISPDHLAILVDSKGACSNDHGCGVNNEEFQFELETDKSQEVKQGDTTFVFNFNKEEGNKSAMKREDYIKALVANCGDCTEEDAKGFDSLSDTALEKTYNTVVGNSKAEEKEEEKEEETINNEKPEPTEAEVYADTLLNEKKQQIATRLVEHIEDDIARNEKLEKLIQKPLGELAELQELLPKKEAKQASAFNYAGQGAFRETVGNQEQEEALALPEWTPEDYK